MHGTTIPKKVKKVNFNLNKKDENKKEEFVSPDSKYSRRMTIQSGKINDGLVQRYSIL